MLTQRNIVVAVVGAVGSFRLNLQRGAKMSDFAAQTNIDVSIFAEVVLLRYL